MYLIASPKIFKLIYKDLIWSIPESEKKIYLTFDDGPEKEVTPAILEILNSFNAKATFFCVGKKALQELEIIAKMKVLGHTIGNHTFSHLRGKKTSVNSFLKDVGKCDEVFKTNFFRPPYGSITGKQIHKLKKRFHIIMWSILPGDFDKKVSKEKCLARSVKYTKQGSIIVFHDNLHSKEKVLYVLPEYLDHFSKLGYTFEALNEELFQQL
jgi:peptidoglycan/xylan/chitin deacetylase (PgdA/CDA1 family)